MKLKVNAGRHMKAVREAAGLSQADLAVDSGVALRSIQNYELNIADPGLLNLASLADALGIGISEYVGQRIDGGDET